MPFTFHLEYQGSTETKMYHAFSFEVVILVFGGLRHISGRRCGHI